MTGEFLSDSSSRESFALQAVEVIPDSALDGSIGRLH